MDFATSTTTPASELLFTVKPTKRNSFILFHALGRTIWLYLVAAWIGIPFLLIAFGLDGQNSIMMAILLFFVVWAISSAISRIQLNNMEYRFYNNKVEYTDGFLIKDKKNIQYSRITNTEQGQGIIERLFSLGHIYIDTASSGGMSAAFSGNNHALSMKFLDKSDELYEKVNHLIQVGSKL